MDIGVPFRTLGRVDVSEAVDFVANLSEEAWALNRFRQEVMAGQPHRQTTRAILLKYNWVPYQYPWRAKTMREIVLDWCRQEGVDPEPITPEIELETQHGAVNVFPQWHEFRSVIEPVVEQAIDPVRTPEGVVNRIAIVEMAAGGRIDPHTDGQDMARRAHRIHVPLIHPPGVEYKIDGKKLKMQVGYAYDFNNCRRHSVRNKARRARVNILIDYQPKPGVKIAQPFGPR